MPSVSEIPGHQARRGTFRAHLPLAAEPLGFPPGQGPSGFGFGVTRSVAILDRAVYSTIAVMSVLIVYDGWQNLKFWAAVGVILGPVPAMFISHVFSAFLARRAELHERPSRASR